MAIRDITIKVREVNSNTEFDLKLRGNSGRLVLRGVGREQVVKGCGSKKETMLADLNGCYVSRTNNLVFEEVDPEGLTASDRKALRKELTRSGISNVADVLGL